MATINSLFRARGMSVRTQGQRAKHWQIDMRNPVNGALLYTVQCQTKRDATADAAWNVRPDRAPSKPYPIYA